MRDFLNFIAGSITADDSRVADNVKTLWREHFSSSAPALHYSKDDTDAAARPVCVNFQKIIEGLIADQLADKDSTVIGVVGCIHTPLPATPLRNTGTITHGLVADAITDPERLATVTDRAHTLRRFMHGGGALVSVYSKDDFDQAVDHAGFNSSHEQAIAVGDVLKKEPVFTDEHVAIFEQAKREYKGYLFENPLPDIHGKTGIPSGATYLVRTRDHDSEAEHTYVFSIQAPQAHAATGGKSPWGLWFGDIDHEVIRDRFDAIDGFLKPHGTDLSAALAINVQVNALTKEIMAIRAQLAVVNAQLSLLEEQAAKEAERAERIRVQGEQLRPPARAVSHAEPAVAAVATTGRYSSERLT